MPESTAQIVGTSPPVSGTSARLLHPPASGTFLAGCRSGCHHLSVTRPHSHPGDEPRTSTGRLLIGRGPWWLNGLLVALALGVVVGVAGSWPDGLIALL